MDRRTSDSNPAGDRPYPANPLAAGEHRPGPDLGDLGREMPAATRAEAAEGTTETDEREIRYNRHITDRMEERGWTAESIRQTINHPHRIIAGQDHRYDPDTGVRNDYPATLYISVDESYVVRRDVDGDLVAISDRTDTDWKRPFT